MDFHVSARKWRPQTFEEVIGQDHVVQVLRNAISQGSAQAYLFSGIRGTGKTSVARILAKALNCPDTEKRPCNTCPSCMEITEGRSVNVVEIDGASNTSVDDIRDLRETIQYLPLRGTHKVYIIDEVHMLSTSAFNALLKTLEEPPAHLVFILATTEAHKIPATILSRCQHFTFRRIARTEIEARLRKVASDRGVELADRAQTFIARVSEGSLRDALSLLDQAIAYSGKTITEESLSTLLGRAASSLFHRLILGIHQKDAKGLLVLARQVEQQGYDFRQLLADGMEHLRNIIVMQNVAGGEERGLVDLPDEELKEIQSAATLFSKEAMQRLFALFATLQEETRNAPRPYLLFEVTLMKAVMLADLQPIEKIMERIAALTTGTGISETVPQPQNKATAPINTTPKSAPIPVLETAGKIETSPRSPEPIPSRKDNECWQNFLKGVREGRPNLASYLAQGTLLDIEKQKLKIGFPSESSFLISLIQKEENKRWLQSLSKNYFNREMQMVLVPMPEPHLEKETDSDPLVQEALRVFGGTIVQTKEL